MDKTFLFHSIYDVPVLCENRSDHICENWRRSESNFIFTLVLQDFYVKKCIYCNLLEYKSFKQTHFITCFDLVSMCVIYLFNDIDVMHIPWIY